MACHCGRDSLWKEYDHFQHIESIVESRCIEQEDYELLSWVKERLESLHYQLENSDCYCEEEG